MRRLSLALAAALAGGVLIWMAVPAAAGPIVDPSTLQPPPPNAVCRADGRQVICDTFVDENASYKVASSFSITLMDQPSEMM